MNTSSEHATTVTESDRRAIRTLWIDDRRESYPVDFLAELLDLDPDVVKDIALDLTPAGEILRDEALMIAAGNVFSPAQIEEALGPDAAAALPPGRRTRVVTVRLSSWLLEGISRAANAVMPTRRDRSIDAVISDALDEYLTSHPHRYAVSPEFEAEPVRSGN